MQNSFDFGEAPTDEKIAPDAVILRQFAKSHADQLLIESELITAQSPYRIMTTPGGGKMSVSISNCGQCGWISDHKGYRYEHTDPLTHQPWPEIPKIYQQLASAACEKAGFPAYHVDACLLNKYEPNSRMGLHQDHDEQDLIAPIISVSLGLDAIFLFGGKNRQHPSKRYLLNHGDVVVFGGASRLNYHGIAAIKPTSSVDNFLDYRLNLTFRKVF